MRANCRWIFRACAIGLGLLPLVLLELALRWSGYGKPISAPIPSVQFVSERRLFVLDDDESHYIVPPSRHPFFKSERFTARKDPREYRIFCFGGSTVQGNPYSIETSFTTWLELSLQAADPGRRWEVVNCGGISYASYRLKPILEECLAYQPDLFILYLGDNEFLEDRSYNRVGLPGAVAWLDQLRLFRAARDLYPKSLNQEKSTPTEPIRLAAEVDALLDYQGGLAQYHRDDAWRAAVVHHFRVTLDGMLAAAQRAGVPVLLIDPVCNLKDCAPFKVESDATLSAHEKDQFEELVRRAGQSPTTASAIADLQNAVEIDPRHAGAWFLLGQAYLADQRHAEAREAFVRAKDEDVCPLRMIEAMRDGMYEAAQGAQVPVIPVMRLFEEKSPHGIPGDELLLDHVHPSITGHQMIAELLLDQLASQGTVQLKDGWRERRQERYRQHLATLDTPYYARGQEHLDGLRKWAQGRVKKLRRSAPP